MKRFLSAILTLIILATAFATCASAADPDSGTCGENLTWRYDSATKTLIIEGSGAMTNWFSNRKVPWKHLRTEAVALSLPQGLTSVGDYAFFGFENIPTLTIPSSVKKIGHGAFSVWKSLKEVTIPEGTEQLGGWVFASCLALEKVTFSSTVRSLDYECFLNCPSLMDVTVPSTLTSIGRKAFGILASHAYNYDMIIRGVPGSGTQSYAESNFLNFVSVYAKSEARSGLYGVMKGESTNYTTAEMDFNGDGIISTKDSLLCKIACGG